MTGSNCAQAPEVYRLEPYNEKADTFSFAMIAYGKHVRTLSAAQVADSFRLRFQGLWCGLQCHAAELLHRYMMIRATDGSLEECQV